MWVAWKDDPYRSIYQFCLNSPLPSIQVLLWPRGQAFRQTYRLSAWGEVTQERVVITYLCLGCHLALVLIPRKEYPCAID